MQTEEILALLPKIRVPAEAPWKKALYVGMAVGLLTFVFTWFINPTMAWQALLVNTVFFGGISMGGLMFSVIGTITDAFWLRPFKRLGEAMSIFSVVTVLAYFVLYFGAQYIFSWANPGHVIATKAGWLNRPYFVIRQLVGFVVLAVLAVIYLKNSILPDLRMAKRLNAGFGGSFFDRFVEKSMGEDEEKVREKAYKNNKYIAPWLGFVFACVASLIAFDWMMSIDQSWFSTMFGAEYVVADLIGAGAVLILLSALSRTRWGLGDYLTMLRHHDITKLTFAFTLLWSYMIFAQVLVIWYANLPEETPFLIYRMKSSEWGWMFWVIFIMIFVFTFLGLMSRTTSRSPVFSSIVAINLLIGLWLEKFFIIIPSIQENQVSHSVAMGSGVVGWIGWQWGTIFSNLGVGIGAFALFLWVVTRFLNRVPALPISDSRLFKPSVH